MNKKQLSIDIIKQWLADNDWKVRTAAMNACNGRDVPLDIIKQGLSDSNWKVRTAAMNACNGRDVPLDIIKQGLSDDDCDVRTAAMNACNGRDVPLDIIKQWLADNDCDVRTAAMNACNGRDVPLDIIKQGLSDSNWKVRTAVTKYIKDNNIENIYIPYRAIEPPEKVYKKCMGDVIVVARIPDDAEVRGSYNSKCRTNKAKIIDIIGAFGGVQVGVSVYDMTTTYFVGDDVYIDDFDLSNNECSTGFHFFCDIEQAKNYNF